MTLLAFASISQGYMRMRSQGKVEGRRTMQFALYDIFCQRPFCGNPAAVIRAEGPVACETLITFAREFNLPETCVYWIDQGTPHMVFATSAGPIRACGHGLLAVLADVVRTGEPGAVHDSDYTVEGLGSGRWTHVARDLRLTEISVSWPRVPTFVKVLPIEPLVSVLGIGMSSLSRRLPAQAFDSGIINGLIPVESRDILLRLQPDYGQAMADYFKEHGLDDLELYALCETDGSPRGWTSIRTRNVFPYGVREEAATGSASVSLATALIRHRPPGATQFRMDQGVSRRGKIVVKAALENGTLTAVWLEGRVQLIASGDDLLCP
jgi:trans-2,3-dihydro-3-hydroxyanthranilate isomerase